MECSEHTSAMTSFVIQVLLFRIDAINGTKINPKVSNDAQTVAEKYPYNFEVFTLLKTMVSEYKKYDDAYGMVFVGATDSFELPSNLNIFSSNLIGWSTKGRLVLPSVLFYYGN